MNAINGKVRWMLAGMLLSTFAHAAELKEEPKEEQDNKEAEKILIVTGSEQFSWISSDALSELVYDTFENDEKIVFLVHHAGVDNSHETVKEKIKEFKKQVTGTKDGSDNDLISERVSYYKGNSDYINLGDYSSRAPHEFYSQHKDKEKSFSVIYFLLAKEYYDQEKWVGENLPETINLLSLNKDQASWEKKTVATAKEIHLSKEQESKPKESKEMQPQNQIDYYNQIGPFQPNYWKPDLPPFVKDDFNNLEIPVRAINTEIGKGFIEGNAYIFNPDKYKNVPTLIWQYLDNYRAHGKDTYLVLGANQRIVSMRRLNEKLNQEVKKQSEEIENIKNENMNLRKRLTEIQNNNEVSKKDAEISNLKWEKELQKKEMEILRMKTQLQQKELEITQLKLSMGQMSKEGNHGSTTFE